MSKYKTYPEYKDSGVEWLGEVPEHWSTLPIKKVSKIFNGATPKSGESTYWNGNISWITPADLGKTNSPYISIGARNISLVGYESCGASLVPVGTIVLSSRAPIGTLGIADKELCTNQGCKSLVVNKLFYNKFLYYVLLSSTEQLNLLGKGTTFLELSSDELGAYNIGTPSSLAEQQTIASFLDYETGKIDKLIKKQEELIALLEEKQQVVISHAVTKGIPALKAGRPMKDSGVEWLGEIPEHWKATRAKFVSTIFVPQRNKPELNNLKGVAWATMEDMKENFILTTMYYVSEQAMEHSDSKILEAGAVIASCVGNFGISSINKCDVIINQQLQAFIPESINAEYLRETIVLSKSYFEQIGTAATLIYVNKQGFEELPVLVPPLKEQNAIVNYLNKATAKIDNLISKAKSAIELMQERRTALISAAVTGKIDVRDFENEEKTVVD